MSPGNLGEIEAYPRCLLKISRGQIEKQSRRNRGVIFLKNGLQRISSNNYFYPLDFPENIDIDNYSDLNLALKINKRKKNLRFSL